MPKRPVRALPARRLLGLVLHQARLDLDQSPEQIGKAIGISGRTIRRLEEGTGTKPPRAITLEALAEHYGLNVSFLMRLAKQGDRNEDLLEADLRAEAASLPSNRAPLEQPVGLLDLAIQLAHQRQAADRIPPSRHGAGEDEVTAVVRDFVRLDRSRRQLVSALVRDLLAARRQEQQLRAAGELS